MTDSTDLNALADWLEKSPTATLGFVKDGLTGIDRLRLHVCDSDTFAFDLDNAEAVIKTYDDLANAVTELVEALERLIIGATAEFNEKGAGGYALARLSDARSALSHYRELAGTSNEVAK